MIQLDWADLGILMLVGVSGLIYARVSECFDKQCERDRGTKAVFEVELDPRLLDAVMRAARDEDGPASQVVRQRMRDFVAKRDHQLGYEAFLQAKVEQDRANGADGRDHTHAEAKAEFAALRAKATEKP